MPQPDPSAPAIIAPAPLLYLGTLTLGFYLQSVTPQSILADDGLHLILGAALLALATLLTVLSLLALRRKGTTPNPRKPASALVADGPFRYSRNPIYVAMTGLYLGIAFLSNAAWLLVLLIPLLALMDWGVIRREEVYLAKRFGKSYRNYQSRVRRWI